MRVTPYMKLFENLEGEDSYAWVFTTGKIYKLKRDYVEHIKYFQKHENINGDSDFQINKKILKELLEARILINNVEDEVNKLKLELRDSYSNSDELHLTILPTENCNFKCIYCYENLNKTFIDDEVIHSILKFISKEILKRNLKYLKITWFGGEPLLALKKIQEFTNLLKNIVDKRDVTYIGNMSTNGYLLTKDTAKELVEIYNIKNFQITVDGPREIHNRYRPLRNGAGSYDVIVKNLIDLKNSNLDFQVFLRINYDITTVSTVIKWLPRFLQMFENDKRFILFPHEIFDFKDACVSPNVPFEMIKFALEYKLGNEISGFFYKYNFCYAARPNSLVIMPDGSLRKCTVALYDKINHVGYINKEGDLILNKNFYKWVDLYHKVPEKCKNCPIYPVCMGVNCPLVRLKSETSLPCPPSLYNIKFAVKKIIKYERR